MTQVARPMGGPCMMNRDGLDRGQVTKHIDRISRH